MKDLVLESWLTREGVKFKYQDIDVEKIDIDEETRQNIRLTATLDKDIVQEYVLALERGDEFPAIVIAPSNKHYVVVNGLHRLEAYKLKSYPIVDAYVLENADLPVLDRLRRSINRIVGKRIDREEAFEHAVYLVRHDGMTVKDAARAMYIPASSLTQRLQTIEVAEKLVAAGVPVDRLSRMTMQSLHQLPRAAQMIAIGRMAHESRLPATTVMDIVKEVRDSGSDDEGNRVIARWQEELKFQVARAGAGNYRPAVSPFKKMEGYLGIVRKMAESKEKTAMGLRLSSATEVKRTVDYLRKTAELLLHYADELEKGSFPDVVEDVNG